MPTGPIFVSRAAAGANVRVIVRGSRARDGAEQSQAASPWVAAATSRGAPARDDTPGCTLEQREHVRVSASSTWWMGWTSRARYARHIAIALDTARDTRRRQWKPTRIRWPSCNAPLPAHLPAQRVSSHGARKKPWQRAASASALFVESGRPRCSTRQSDERELEPQISAKWSARTGRVADPRSTLTWPDHSTGQVPETSRNGVGEGRCTDLEKYEWPRALELRMRMLVDGRDYRVSL